jgi:predicted Fe-S protein YdhL (DUF1289 family)
VTDDAQKPPAAFPSPCVRNCCLDERDVCLGCYRTIDEICGWSAASNAEKGEILERCRQRREKRGRL